MKLPIANKFYLQINLGNANMKDLVDVANVLKKLSERLMFENLDQTFVQSDKLFDRNGNQVGTWRTSKVKTIKTNKNSKK